MRIGDIAARPGERVFGYLPTGTTRSGLSMDMPIHLVAGKHDGPTLLVQGAMHGTEIFGTLGILRLLKQLNPNRMRGNLIAVPVVNRMGFEQQTRGVPLDGKDISRQGFGDPNGSISDQIAHVYAEQVAPKANAMIDFHSGGQTAYEYYVLFDRPVDPNNLTPLESLRRQMVLAFGLERAASFAPNAFGIRKKVAAELNIPQITPEFGGGAGYFVNGQACVERVVIGITNVLKAMGILDGELQFDGPTCTIYDANVLIWKPKQDGFYVPIREWGDALAAGDVFAYMVDPYTGERLAEITTPEPGIVLPSGAMWPVIGATTIGILGQVTEIVPLSTQGARFQTA